METSREILRWVHVVLGFTGLIAFWFPVFARKGGRLHRVAGKVFITSGYAVTGSAALSCLLVAYTIVSRDVVAQNRDNLAAITFLGYLAWVTFVSLRYAVGVLRAKQDPTRLATPEFRFLGGASIAASVALVIFAAAFPSRWSLLLYVLAPIGVGTGWPILKFLRGGYASKKAWFYEHMSATIGAGIAFHTAFAVFGASRLFTLPTTGLLSILPWVLPAAVGTPALAIWKRHYQRKFGDRPPRNARPGPRPALPVRGDALIG